MRVGKFCKLDKSYLCMDGFFLHSASLLGISINMFIILQLKKQISSYSSVVMSTMRDV